MQPPSTPAVYRDSTYVDLSVRSEALRVLTVRHEDPGPERLLLIHGNPGSMLDFAPMLDSLEGLGDVTAYDTPGFGWSPSPHNRELLSIDALAEIAVALLDRLGWHDAILVGHSHGGGVAQRVAARWPDRVRALVLLGTLGAPAHGLYRILPRPGVEWLLSAADRSFPAMSSTLQRRLVGYFLARTHAPRAIAREDLEDEIQLLHDNRSMLRNMARVTRGNPCGRLHADAPRIVAPTVFVHGTEDRTVPTAYAHHIYERMLNAGRDAEFIDVVGAGHMLPAEEPEVVVEAIRARLARGSS
ncbi:MAG: alpha/beta hydrolase [Myxococcota bacterium]